MRYAIIYTAILILVSGMFLSSRENVKDETKDKTVFDYSLYARTLSAYADNNGMVDYKGLKKNRINLDLFVKTMGDLNKKKFDSWNEDQKIAFLVNAYNALTLRVIIDNYPIKPGGFFARRRYPHNSLRQIDGVWDEITFKVMGQDMTLEYIEHKILRKKFNQPYIHMALVCAAMSCPKLRNKPYTGNKLKEQFENQTRNFISNTKKFKIDRSKKRVYLSSIFKWFDDDFEKTYKTSKKEFPGHDSEERAVLDFIAAHLSKQDREYLKNTKTKIKYLDYDWSLNEQKGKQDE